MRFDILSRETHAEHSVGAIAFVSISPLLPPELFVIASLIILWKTYFKTFVAWQAFHLFFSGYLIVVAQVASPTAGRGRYFNFSRFAGLTT